MDVQDNKTKKSKTITFRLDSSLIEEIKKDAEFERELMSMR